ncbi:zinc transporter ZIP10 [Brachyhypopomus gauderio]|uniref:zinc transporter ZIP10 n=1 Tax=Brachyhypopomus gauderio TaxID=698409 RepID=UPI0040425530
MRVHVHTKFCFLCVLTLLFHHCSHCHEGSHHHHHHHQQQQHENSHDLHDHNHVHSDLQISKASYTGLSDQPTPKSQGETAEHEQLFYIQQLFRRYGQQDRLDFGGFQNLLLSLGLGEVRVVGLHHEDLGHDHVAHLDLLEVQEGLHSHSAAHPHPKSHSHHNHPHSHGDAVGEQPTTARSCKPSYTTGVSPTVDTGSHQDQDHDLHEHEHELGGSQTQNAEHDHNHDHEHTKHEHLHNTEVDSYRPQQVDNTSPHDHDHSHDQDQQDKDHTQENNDLGHNHAPVMPVDHTHGHRELVVNTQPFHQHTHHHHKHLHPHHHHHTAHTSPTQPTQVSRLSSPGPDTQPSPYTPSPTAVSKRLRRLQRGRPHNRNKVELSPTIGPEVDASGSDHHRDDRDHGDHSHGHGQSHKGKREVPEETTSVNVSTLAVHLDNMMHQHEECLNLTELLHHYGLSPDSLITPSQFTYLCPALLYQIDSRLCIRHYHQVDVQEATPQAPPLSVWIWTCGFVSITLISLLSLLGVVLVPILNQACFKFLLTFLVALAVGTLSGDALLHLLPHSQGGHDHSHGEASVEREPVGLLVEFDSVWKGLTALAGIYLLFIIEHCISMVKHYKDQGGRFCRRKKKGEEGQIGRKLSDHKLNRRSDAEWMHLRPLTEGSHNDTQLTEVPPPDSPSKTPLSSMDGDNSHQGDAAVVKDSGRKAKTKKHGHHGHSHHGHSHHGHCHSDKEMKDAGIASIAWMVIMGDGMHNFSDGLAIGAAFSANITGGISTSVAVFCHELPHELGDFAVLLKAGMSVKQAIVYNLLSALMAYFGMVIGTAVGQYAHNVTSWIFAITAGMFLYVALVDMLPEMLHGDSEGHKRCHMGHFVLQNMGMLTGFAIMLLIAIFEDHIVVDLDF